MSHRRRFDVGSGMATIRDPNPIKLGEFHTVELHRNLTLGSLIVDGGDAINGSSQVELPLVPLILVFHPEVIMY